MLNLLALWGNMPMVLSIFGYINYQQIRYTTMKRVLTVAAVAVVGAVALYMCNSTMKRVKVAEFSGDDLTAIAHIKRERVSKEAKFVIEKDMKWELYLGRSVEEIELGAPILKGDKAGSYDVPLPERGVRYYFQLITPKGNAILAERLLPMEGGYNFRDLGGMRTQEGRYVKWGKILRSDGLDRLEAADLHYLASIPLKSVVDFRYDREVEEAPDRLPHTVDNLYSYSVKPGSFYDFMAEVGDNPQKEQMVAEMKAMNIRMVTQSEIVEQYRKVFALLMNDEDVPLMFHCSAGKDRTGLAAALILHTLGVDWERIIEDYLESNLHLGDKYREEIEENPVMESLMVVKRKYIEAGMEKVKEQYGSIDSFVENELRVDVKAFRERFLYPKK